MNYKGDDLLKFNISKIILKSFPFILYGSVFWFTDKVSFLLRTGRSITNQNVFGLYISLNKIDIIAGVFVTAVFLFVKNRKKGVTRNGEEYGSARWGTAKDIKPYIDKKFENNIILTNTERIMLGRNKIPKYNINKNVLVIGGSGSGKTRFHVKPNIMQMNASYVITDPKGTILLECGNMLKNNGYKIKVLNLIDFSQSMRYNPFNYIKKESDILSLINCIMENTTDKNKTGGDEFWSKAESLYYQAIVSYIWEEVPQEEKNMNKLLEMLNSSEVSEENENFKNETDILFENLKNKNPESYAVRQYTKYKLAAGKTAKSILISCAARMSPFDIKSVRDILSTDDLEIDKIGDEKTALFVIVSDTDSTFDFIAGMLYTQMFNVLCEKALENDGALKEHVTFLLDEFANQKIPNFERTISVIRSRNISAHIVLQSYSQLKSRYKDDAETITNNCDSFLFLGGKGSTLKEISASLGKQTIDVTNKSETFSNQKSFGNNTQKTGRELMTQDELELMDGNKCICQIRGIRPFLSDKFDITKHKQYHNLYDYDKRNRFDVKKYIDNYKCNINFNDENQLYEVFELNKEDL